MTTYTPLALLKAQLNIEADDTRDDVLLQHKLAAAENWAECFIGGSIWSNHYPAVTEAILQLAAYWFEQREAASFGTSTQMIPFGVHELLSPYRGAVTGYVRN